MSVAIHPDDKTTIISAAQRGDVITVEKLLSEISSRENISKGEVVLYCKDAEENTPLHAAAAVDVPDIIDYCNEDDKFPSQPGKKKMLLEAPNSAGDTALMVAAKHGSTEILRKLLEAGANTTAINSVGFTALHWAAWSGKLETIQILLSKGAIVNETNLGGETALHLAASKGHSNIVSELIDHDADRGLRNAEGLTAEEVARRTGHGDNSQ